MLAPLPAASSTLVLPYLGYDPSTFELSGPTPRGLQRRHGDDLAVAFAGRVAQEKARKELAVYYYRINHTMAFPLPLAARPEQMPKGIPEMRAYPWLTWLSWALEERWRLLLAAWQRNDDRAAGELLQKELAALAGWNSFVEWNGEAGLALGHIAGILALVLQQTERLQPEYLPPIRQAGLRLLERDTLPWYAKHWAAIQEPLEAANLHNIPLIALTRSAQLARALEHSATDQLDTSAKRALDAWCRLRLHPMAPHTEGTAYDGYLMDSVTEWLEGLPEKVELLTAYQPALLSLVQHWLAMALPGRVDLQAPIGDVEPEMPFWMSVLVRLSLWYQECDHNGGWWLLQHLPPDRMPAAALVLLLAHAERMAVDAPAPAGGSPQVVPNAVVLRSGWAEDDLLVAVGAGGSRMSHLHQDSGQVVIGWQNRFWLTDPGYQQYRRGEERDFTMGEAAHNAPVISGIVQTPIVQTQRAAQIMELVAGKGQQYTRLDLTECYEGLPEASRVVRHIWLMLPPVSISPRVIVANEYQGLAAGTEIRNAWHFGTHLAWAFQEGWARLSDGERTLWVTSLGIPLSPQHLLRHAGSRGPLTLVRHHILSQSPQTFWWVFHFEPTITWAPPTVDLAQIRVRSSAPSVA
jgi:hypothetical protein